MSMGSTLVFWLLLLPWGHPEPELPWEVAWPLPGCRTITGHRSLYILGSSKKLGTAGLRSHKGTAMALEGENMPAGQPSNNRKGCLEVEALSRAG
jgi:hypothetical protein